MRAGWGGRQKFDVKVTRVQILLFDYVIVVMW